MLHYRYKERVIKLAETMEDTPRPALEEAIWWTEYVLRHKNVHLKGATVQDSPNEYNMLYIIATLISIFLMFCFITFWTVRVMFKRTVLQYHNIIVFAKKSDPNNDS